MVGGVDVTMSKFNTQKYIIKCAQDIGYTCSMCEQSYHPSISDDKHVLVQQP